MWTVTDSAPVPSPRNISTTFSARWVAIVALSVKIRPFESNVAPRCAVTFTVFAFAAMGCATGWAMAGATVKVYPAPAEEKLSEDFGLTVSGQPVPVYSCRVSAIPFNRLWPGHQRPLEQTELASFAPGTCPARWTWRSFRAGGGVCVVARPPAHPGASEGESHSLPACRFLPITVASTARITLHLADAMPALHPSWMTPVRYFGPGAQPGRMTLESNQTIYIAAEPWSTAASRRPGLEHQGARARHPDEASSAAGPGCIRLTNCRDVVVDGVILRDPDVVPEHVRLFGGDHRERKLTACGATTPTASTSATVRTS
jgi:hypothetical protein